MAMVIVLCLVVFVVLGVLFGGLLAHCFQRALLFSIWATVSIGAAYVFLDGRAADEFDRISANMLVFTVIVPFLGGSLIAAIVTWRKVCK